MLFFFLFFVLAISSKLHIATVELDLGNKVCNGTIFFFILIDLFILERPLLFVQIERLKLLCVIFLVAVAPLQLVRDGRVLSSVAIRRKEGYLLSCKHLWSPGTLSVFFIGIHCKLWRVGSDCVVVAAREPTLNFLTYLLIFNNRLLLVLKVIVIIWVCLFNALVHYIVDALVWESDRLGGSIDGVVAFNFATLFTRKSRYLLVTIVVCHLQLLTAKLN